MSTTRATTSRWTNPIEPQLRRPEMGNLGEAAWQALLDEDHFALSSVSFLLTAIIGLGLVGLAVVVCVLAFSG